MIVLILSPSPTITAIEGESIEITCGPLGAAIVNIIIEVDTAQLPLPFQDINMQRVFTFGPVDRSQQGIVFQCVSGAFTTNTATLEVFCKQIMCPYSSRVNNRFCMTLSYSTECFPSLHRYRT